MIHVTISDVEFGGNGAEMSVFHTIFSSRLDEKVDKIL